jgi:alpha-beta hydrolase superfamily lysophospholipase
LPEGVEEAGGLPIKRNPGVICLWITRSFEVFFHENRPLITVGAPAAVTWWCAGRAATRAEVDASITGGYPTLLATAKVDGPVAVEMLERAYRTAELLLPGAG